MTWIHRHARLLLGVYSVLLALALFAPTSGRQSDLVVWLSDVLVRLGSSPSFVTFDRMEVVMNAVIVAPVTFLASLVWATWSWRDWTAAGFVAAVAVEATQGLLLTGRQAAFSDVVANTAGALAGAVIVVGARSMLRARKSR